MDLNLILSEIKDNYIRENFFRLVQFCNLLPFKDFKFFQVSLEKGGTAKIAHGLSFIPKDIIQTSVLGDQNVYFNYQDFDRTFIYLTADGPCVLRFFVGSYDNKAYGANVVANPPFVAPNILSITIDGGTASDS